MNHASRFLTADLEAALPRLRRYARVLVGGLDGADELVAQTLAGAWRGSIPPAGTDFLTWLFGLMRAAYGREPARASSASHDSDNLRARVMHLPLDEREVLLLVTVERLSYTDIAGLLDMPVATVIATLSRARGRLGTFPSIDDGTKGEHPAQD